MSGKSNYNKWSKIIQNWEQSGLSQKRYCQEKSINLSTFYYYKRRLPQNPGLIELPAPFVRKERSIGLHLQSSSIELNIPEGFDKQSLSDIFNLLGVSHVL